MIRRIVLSLALLQPSLALAKPRECFSSKEAEAIQAVRHGIRLRETAVRCQQEGLSTETLDLWRKIDKAVGSQFRAQTDMRREAFKREFDKWADWNLSTWDGRIVLHFRHRPLNKELCTDMAAMLKEINEKGWGAFSKQAVKLRDEVREDYQICGK